jgi:hypothetical protein
VVVVIWATPSVQVARGDLLTYQIQVKNFNRSAKDNVRVYIPYDSSQLTIVGAEFEDADDWVSELSPVHVLVTFPKLGGGETRTASLQARVANDLPDGTVITTWPSYSWANSETTDDPRSSNAMPVVVGPTSETSPFVWTGVQPQRGPVGMTFGFFSDRFLPYEEVMASLAVPGDVTADQDLSVQADPQGRVWISFWSGKLQPGTYDMLLEGEWSNLQGKATFTVE